MASQTAELQGAAGCGLKAGILVRHWLTRPRLLTLPQTLEVLTPIARCFSVSFSWTRR